MSNWVTVCARLEPAKCLRINAPTIFAASTLTRSALWKSIGTLILRVRLYLRPIQGPGVLVEVDVMVIVFEFAALEVHVIGTHRFLGRSQILIMIRIGDHAVPV